jgi:RNA polymerase sigma-70 factor, ECF subfamily
MKDSEKEKLFSVMFNENRAKVYRLCFAYLIDKSEVDDLFQEVMINVWNNLDKFRGDSKPSTWIYRIAVNSAFMFNRKTKKSKDLFSNFIPETASSDAQSSRNAKVQEEKMINQLHQSIQCLEKQDRIIITLVLEGLKYHDIAEITGLTISHIGVKINRIKPVLLKKMKEVQHG